MQNDKAFFLHQLRNMWSPYPSHRAIIQRWTTGKSEWSDEQTWTPKRKGAIRRPRNSSIATDCHSIDLYCGMFKWRKEAIVRKARTVVKLYNKPVVSVAYSGVWLIWKLSKFWLKSGLHLKDIYRILIIEKLSKISTILRRLSSLFEDASCYSLVNIDNPKEILQ